MKKGVRRRKKKKKKAGPMHNSEETTALAVQWIRDRRAAGTEDLISPSHPQSTVQKKRPPLSNNTTQRNDDVKPRSPTIRASGVRGR